MLRQKSITHHPAQMLDSFLSLVPSVQRKRSLKAGEKQVPPALTHHHEKAQRPMFLERKLAGPVRHAISGVQQVPPALTSNRGIYKQKA